MIVLSDLTSVYGGQQQLLALVEVTEQYVALIKSCMDYGEALSAHTFEALHPDILGQMTFTPEEDM